MASSEGESQTNVFTAQQRTSPNGINDAGQIVGSYDESTSGPEYGFLLSGGSFLPFNLGGTDACRAERYVCQHEPRPKS